MTPVHEKYQEDFLALEKSLNGQSRSPVHALRKNAMERFLAAGFPTTRDEEWRFTSVTPIARTAFRRARSGARVTSEQVKRFDVPGVRAARLVFVNGHVDASLSDLPRLPQGVVVESLSSALRNASPGLEQHLGRLVRAEENGFTALNTAFLWDGAFIHVPDGIALDVPVHLVFLVTEEAEGCVIHPRTLILAGRGATLSIVETYAGLSPAVSLTNAVTEVFAGDGAVLEHDKLQMEGARAFHVGSNMVRLGARATFTSNAIHLGGALVRNTVGATLAGEGGECTLNGLSLATGTQHIDNHTSIDHAVPGCASHELYKAILDGKSRGVFNGKIFVRKDAQKTDAKQTNRTLLLSDDATIDTKPQLEIFADDVKCTHGATVGQLDDEQVFYLRSRGIGMDAARDILTFAFASDVIDRVHTESLREELHTLVHHRLHEGRLTDEHD